MRAKVKATNTSASASDASRASLAANISYLLFLLLLSSRTHAHKEKEEQRSNTNIKSARSFGPIFPEERERERRERERKARPPDARNQKRTRNAQRTRDKVVVEHTHTSVCSISSPRRPRRSMICPSLYFYTVQKVKIFRHKFTRSHIRYQKDVHLKRCPSTESSRASRLALCTSARTPWSVNPR